MVFVPVAKVSDIPPGTIRECPAGGKTVAVANVSGKFYAIDNVCLHRGGPLGQGALDGNVVTCPWHAWQFNVATGKAGESATVGVACYTTEVRGDEIFVDAG
ncbi:MAG: hypothetical protein NVS9B4_27110 [Candidatus Acidiferrum sp.]